MNAGHASLLTVELAYEKARERGESTISREAVQAIKPLCVFTTHTPVAAGHDQFPLTLVARVITGRSGNASLRSAWRRPAWAARDRIRPLGFRLCYCQHDRSDAGRSP
jgi:glucan phosphorylase